MLVAEQGPGYLTLLRDNGDGHAVWIDRHVEDLNKPYGLAWQDDHLLVADQDGIWKVPHVVGALRAGKPVPPQKADSRAARSRSRCPALMAQRCSRERASSASSRATRTVHLAIDPKSGALFVGVGSSGNLGIEPEPKATIQRFDPDGSNQTTFASGTRNSTALAFHPETGDLGSRSGAGWTWRQSASDYLIRVQQGGFYGWPYAYIGNHPQPGFAQLAPDKVNAAITPGPAVRGAFLALDLVFYEGDQFPTEYKGAFSWL